MTKISIVIPVYKTESPSYIHNTLIGVSKTIGIDPDNYTITLVGSLPPDMFSPSVSDLPKWDFIPTTSQLGDSKNAGFRYVVNRFDPQVVVFMDAHMNFFSDESKNWGTVIVDYLLKYKNAIVAPAVSIYDVPSQRGYGVITRVSFVNSTADLAWQWVGHVDAQNPYAPIEVPGLCGCFMAMTPGTFNKSVIGFTPPLAIDDREFSLRMWTFGVDLYCIPSVTVGHRFSSGYTDFTKKRSIEWGVGMLLYAFLNMPEYYVKRLFDYGIGASQDKDESLKIATSPYWQQVRREVAASRVRTYKEYYDKFGDQGSRSN